MADLATAGELLDVHNCTRLVVQYTHDIDLGHPERVWELFTDDGVWEMPAAGLVFRGHDQLRQGIVENLAVPTWAARHVCTNIAINLTGPNDAEGLTYFINYRHVFDHPVDARADLDRELAPIGPVRHIGEYIDRFRRTDDGWRIAHRRTRLGFSYRA